MTGVHSVVGVEIGGTFTDFVTVKDGQIKTTKVLTTPGQLEVGVLQGLDELDVDFPSAEAIVHGSTIATNAVIERRGARAGLITTEGFRDVLELQRGDKHNVYDIAYRKPVPLVPRDRAVPVRERITSDGRELRPLDPESVREALEYLLKDKGIESLAVCLLHSYANPSHERAVRSAAMEMAPHIPVTLSSEILPEFREYERASTTTMNAYVAPIVSKYLGRLEREFHRRGFRGQFLMMQSNGGVLTAFGATQLAVRTLLSGPAAGVIGAQHVLRQVGVQDAITLDMGGTSTDVCLLRAGVPTVSTRYLVDGLPLRIPVIDITTVGAGGGSIAWLDPGGMMRVGPQSAGASPGPACYGRGGTAPTVTDANVLRGLIREKSFAGGRIPLDTGAAERALKPLSEALGCDVVQAADSVVRVVDSNMVQAIRLQSTERGHDPRGFVLVAFGGAGPLHAATLAAELGMRGVLVPRTPGLLSAVGLIVADIMRDYVQTAVHRLSHLEPQTLLEKLSLLEARAREDFAREKVVGEGFSREFLVDARYVGQGYELTMPVDPARVQREGVAWLSEQFHHYHRQRYGVAAPRESVEIVNLRLVARAPRPGALPALKHQPSGPIHAETGRIFVEGRWREAQFLLRSTLPGGTEVLGPAVIEEDNATTLVPPGWSARVDDFGNLFLTGVQAR